MDTIELLDEDPNVAVELELDSGKLLEKPITVLLCAKPPTDEENDGVTGDVGMIDEEKDCRLDVLTEDETVMIAEDTEDEDETTPADGDTEMALVDTNDEMVEEALVAEPDTVLKLIKLIDEAFEEDEATPVELEDVTELESDELEDPGGACIHQHIAA